MRFNENLLVIEILPIEQVRKRGLAPLFRERGQAPLPDLLYSCSLPDRAGGGWGRARRQLFVEVFGHLAK